MSDTKEFHIGAILSAMTGRLLCPFGDVYDILGWLVNESLMTHQLPRVSRECEGFLRSTFPDLASVDVQQPTITNEAECMAFLSTVAAEHGTTRQVPRLPANDHTHISPLAELMMIRPDAQVIVIDTTKGE